MSSGCSPSPIGDVVARLAAAAESNRGQTADPIRTEAIADGRLVELPEVRRRARERDWAARGIPERLWAMLHDGAPDEPIGPLAARPTAALDAVSRFLAPDDPKTSLVLTGPVGSGKTVGAVWGATWNGGRVVKALDLVRAGLYPADPGFWPRLERERVLVIDDLGTEPLDGKGFGLAAIEDLIDRRYDGARKTIATTNLTKDAFRARFGERVWRRLVEAGRWVELGSTGA